MEHLTLFRGDGGETECRPNKLTEIYTVNKGELNTFTWPPILDEPRQPIDENIDLNRLKNVWKGNDTDEYAIGAIIGRCVTSVKLGH